MITIIHSTGDKKFTNLDDAFEHVENIRDTRSPVTLVIYDEDNSRTETILTGPPMLVSDFILFLKRKQLVLRKG